MGKLTRRVWLGWLVIPALVVVGSGWWFITNRHSVQATPSALAEKPTRRVITKTYADYSQIVLLDDKLETFLTDDRFNNTQPFLRDEYIVWLRELPEETQVVRYHISSRDTQTLQSTKQAMAPKVATDGQVVWQRWENEDWYISYFDGVTTHDLPIVGLYPNIVSNAILFARRSVSQDWELVRYDLTTNNEEVLAVDPSVKQSWIDETAIRFPNGLIPLQPSPSPSPIETTPPRIIDPETTPNEPDMVAGEPSRIPPGDARLIYGESEPEAN